MITASPSSSASSSPARGDAAAAQGAQPNSIGKPSSVAEQARFEAALERAAARPAPRAQRANPESDDETDDRPDREPAEPTQRPDMNDGARREAPRDLASSDPELALSVSTACLQALPWAAPIEAPPAPAGLSMEQFSAALARLQAPAQTQGAQQWQFGLADAAGPLQGVQLHMPANGSGLGSGLWQVSVYGSARDRSALHAHLDKLRERLQARGAPVGEVRMDDGELPS